MAFSRQEEPWIWKREGDARRNIAAVGMITDLFMLKTLQQIRRALETTLPPNIDYTVACAEWR